MSVLTDILSTSTVIDDTGTAVPVHSNTSHDQCDFLQRIIAGIEAEKCLEVGLAYGISSLAIAEAISRRDGRSLISIDPFQRTSWKGIGLLNLERAGFSPMVRFFESPSYAVLPRLLLEGTTLDFAYVDTTKIFDTVLVDAFYITRMLKVGGVVVFDDCDWPGIRALVRYLATWPHLEVYGVHGRRQKKPSTRTASAAARALPYGTRVFRRELIQTDAELGVDASCVAFRKVRNDDRPWDWSGHP
jgi:predicted O-methyltransferase YrrM